MTAPNFAPPRPSRRRCLARLGRLGLLAPGLWLPAASRSAEPTRPPAALLRVGRGQAVKSLAEAAARARDGMRVEVEAG
ncbi:MAG: hypothetical protein ABW360_09360, partial [Phenylobacterium sp.]